MTLDVCVLRPSVPPAVTEARTYPVAPGSVTVQAGILVGEITEMQVTERVEQSAGRRVSRAKLTAALALTNSSASQSVRLVAGKIQYLDDQWRPIELEESRTEATFSFTTYGRERLDPGRRAVEALDVVFPAEALKAKKLRGLRLKIAYIPFPYREEAITFAVSLDGGA
ncbi:MAG: hypothetical protein DMD93_10195 [Candidatus Rokuibacteriota bacterium]|nr:MAG: hypothetical protein DMD93_10195 [Candidatus Rokubacteria bacterium]